MYLRPARILVGELEQAPLEVISAEPSEPAKLTNPTAPLSQVPVPERPLSHRLVDVVERTAAGGPVTLEVGHSEGGQAVEQASAIVVLHDVNQQVRGSFVLADVTVTLSRTNQLKQSVRAEATLLRQRQAEARAASSIVGEGGGEDGPDVTQQLDRNRLMIGVVIALGITASAYGIWKLRERLQRAKAQSSDPSKE